MKKELFISLVGVFIILAIISYYIYQYKNSQKSIINRKKNLISSSISKAKNTNLTLTKEEVAKHNSPNDCWFIINDAVYQITEYLILHPGGTQGISLFCGKDATQGYLTKNGKGGHSSKADQDLFLLKLGNLNQSINLQTSSEMIKNNINQIINSPKRRK